MRINQIVDRRGTGESAEEGRILGLPASIVALVS